MVFYTEDHSGQSSCFLSLLGKAETQKNWFYLHFPNERAEAWLIAQGYS